jgi:hypothetical protein
VKLNFDANACALGLVLGFNLGGIEMVRGTETQISENKKQMGYIRRLSFNEF